MKIPVVPKNEAKRIGALHALNILDTKPDSDLQRLVELAAIVTESPVSLVSLIDKSRQWFKAKVGIDIEQTEREISFCGHTITQPTNEIFEVQSADLDERFNKNPLVLEEPNIRFYAGAPLVTQSGYKIGTLCVVDSKSKKLSLEQKKQLKLISEQVIRLIEIKNESEINKKKYDDSTIFLSKLSHEIRTALTSISGYSDILIERLSNNTDKLVSDSLSSINASRLHLLELVGDVLDLSKLDAKQISRSDQIVDIFKFINQVVKLKLLDATNKGIFLKVVFSEQVPQNIFVDPLLLRQVILNLLSNAIKFTEQGGVKVDVDYIFDDQKLSISISDTGLGIAENEIEKLFAAYEQTTSGKQSAVKGTGLGLIISQKLAKVLGGRINLTWSRVGVGSHFQLLVSAATIQEAQKKQITNTINTEKIIKKKKLSLLVVDDVKENRFLFKYYLKKFNFLIDEASNAGQAKKLFRENSYDYIFLDIQLGDTNGLDLLKDLRQIDKNSNNKFIAFTASSTEQEKQFCLKNGFTGFVAKPFDKKAIFEVIKI